MSRTSAVSDHFSHIECVQTQFAIVFTEEHHIGQRLFTDKLLNSFVHLRSENMAQSKPIDIDVTQLIYTNKQRTYSLAFEFFFDFGMLKIRSKVYANRSIFEYRNGRIVGTSVNIDERFTLRFTIFEKYNFAARNDLQILQCFSHLVFVLVV